MHSATGDSVKLSSSIPLYLAAFNIIFELYIFSEDGTTDWWTGNIVIFSILSICSL